MYTIVLMEYDIYFSDQQWLSCSNDCCVLYRVYLHAKFSHLCTRISTFIFARVRLALTFVINLELLNTLELLIVKICTNPTEFASCMDNAAVIFYNIWQ